MTPALLKRIFSKALDNTKALCYSWDMDTNTDREQGQFTTEKLFQAFLVRPNEKGACPVCFKRVRLTARRSVATHGQCVGNGRLAVMGG